MKHISILTSNDIIIFDRWYHGKNLVDVLNNRGIGYIFRMKCNSLLFNRMSNGQSKIINYCGHDVQLFKYKIKVGRYYILTSIAEDILINEIKALYWKRWKIETDNKKFKYDILLNNVRSKNYNTFMVDIESI